jgi:hypothetical protein
MNKLTLAVLAAGLAVTINANAAFVNGGFETGDLTGWTSKEGANSYNPYGYNPFGTTYGAGMEGSHWAWLAGYETSIYMEQTISGLTIGTSYNVNFIMASEAWNSDKLIVTHNGLGSQTFSAPPIKTTFWDNWVAKQYTFTAGSTSETIRFSTFTLINAGGYDVGFDDVSISAVPEPSTVIAGALLLLPFGASAVRVLRNRKSA